jgi:hypothetical protein
MKRLILCGVTALLLAVPAWSQDYTRPGRSREIVRDWYARYLHREPDREGLDFWSADLQKGMTPREVLASLLSTAYSQLANNDPEDFTRLLFQQTLGRDPTPSEFRRYTRLADTVSFKGALDDFLEAHPDLLRTPRPRDEERYRPPPPPPPPYRR